MSDAWHIRLGGDYTLRREDGRANLASVIGPVAVLSTSSARV